MCFDPDSKWVSISLLVRENKATSAPEISAEQNSNINKRRLPISTELDTSEVRISKIGGSGSKI